MKRLSIEIWLFFVKLGNRISGRLTNVDSFDKTVNNKWNKTKIDGEVICSDGSEYYLLTKANHGSNKLLIYFSGGGANWDEASSQYALSPENMAKGRGKFFENIPPYKMMFMGGMVDERVKDNAFNDFNIVYIPYTTGDFHIGNNEVTYTPIDGDDFTVRHNGIRNVEAALKFVRNTFDNVETLVVGGESAGGFAASFWAPKIIELYPKSQSAVLVDCSYLVSDKWPDVIKNNWGTDFKGYFGYEIGSNLIGDALEHVCAQFPKTRVLQIASLKDQILMDFETEINEMKKTDEYKDNWSKGMQDCMQALDIKYPNYNYYFTNYDMNKDGETRHTFTTWKEYYKVCEKDVPLDKWVVESVELKRKDSISI